MMKVFNSGEGNNIFWLALKHQGFKDFNFTVHVMRSQSQLLQQSINCSLGLRIIMSIVCVSLEWTREAPAKLLFFSPAHGTMTKDSHLLLLSQTMVCAIKDLCYDCKDLMTDPMGNSFFCFPETPSGLQGKTVWHIKSQR